MSRLASLERRVRRLEKAVGPPPRKATKAQVRRDFIRTVNKQGGIDYLEFWRQTGYPYELVEAVLAEFVEKGQLVIED